MLFQTITFFRQVSPCPSSSARCGTRVSLPPAPGGSEGQFGLIPLLAGTLYIATVALLVAVPVGLMSAVYMSEYASRLSAPSSSRRWNCSPASRPSSTASSRW
jgi:phosphate transport system permease protein